MNTLDQLLLIALQTGTHYLKTPAAQAQAAFYATIAAELLALLETQASAAPATPAA